MKAISDRLAWRAFWNTIRLNLLGLIFGFPAPIILALLINELKSKSYAKLTQTITYLPHFISLVVVCGMIKDFTLNTGLINNILTLLTGGAWEAKTLLNSAEYFIPIYVISDIWQGVGWGSIIYISALSSIDQELYEAAVIDGAGKWRQVIHITLPGIASTIIILLIMRIGRLLSVGYEKVLLLQTPQTANVARVISSYVYEVGLGATIPVPNALSLSSAVGIFSSLVNILMLFLANTVSRKFSESSLF